MTTCEAVGIELAAENAERKPREKLPPGQRDWFAYRLVKVEELTTREAAKQLRISQTRVCQLIGRVVEYMTDVAPGNETPEARGRRLFIAENVAAERIDYLYRRVCDSYRQSIGPQTIVRETTSDIGLPKSTKTIKHSTGDGRLAMAAARLAQLSGKTPANCLLPQLPDDFEEAGEDIGDDDYEVADEMANETSAPPVEGCSRNSSEQALTATAELPARRAKALLEMTSVADPELAAMLKFLESRPVQIAEIEQSPPGLPRGFNGLGTSSVGSARARK
jgi:hypothetical protein